MSNNRDNISVSEIDQVIDELGYASQTVTQETRRRVLAWDLAAEIVILRKKLRANEECLQILRDWLEREYQRSRMNGANGVVFPEETIADMLGSIAVTSVIGPKDG